MRETVYRVLGLVCAIVATVPIGTNMGLVWVFWMLVSGRLLATRGAVIPGLSLLGLEAPAVRRAWVALGQGSWPSSRSSPPTQLPRPSCVPTPETDLRALAGYRPAGCSEVLAGAYRLARS